MAVGKCGVWRAGARSFFRSGLRTRVAIGAEVDAGAGASHPAGSGVKLNDRSWKRHSRKSTGLS